MHGYNDPYNPQYAHPGGGHDHGNPAVSNAPQGIRTYFNQNIGRVGQYQEMGNGLSHGQHILVVCKDAEDDNSEKIQDPHGNECGQHCQKKSGLHAGLDPLPVAKAEVLADKGGDGNAQRLHAHPKQGINFSIGSPGGDDCGAQGVDGSLDDDVSQGVHGRLHSCGGTYTYHFPELREIYF